MFIQTQNVFIIGGVEKWVELTMTAVMMGIIAHARESPSVLTVTMDT